MEFSDVIRGRSSVRRFSGDKCSDEAIEAIIDEASWAPSTGNRQPWRVVALGPREVPAFLEEFEDKTTELILPALQMALEEKALESGAAMSQEQVRERAQTLADTVLRFSLAPPSHMLLVYSQEGSLGDWLGQVRGTVGAVRNRLPQKRSWRQKLDYLTLLGSHSSRFQQVMRSGQRANLATFIFGITLAAYNRGIGSCISYAYALNHGPIKARYGLGFGDELEGAIALGYPDDTPMEAAPEIEARTRNPVPTRWIR